jgi:hypothetical protein
MLREYKTEDGRDNERKRRRKEEDADECRRRDGPIVGAAKRPARHLEQGLDDDDKNRGLDADKGSLDQRHMAEPDIGEGQREDDARAGQHEQQAGGEPAQSAVQAPADVGGKLHGLGPRKQHAEVERMQEAVLRDPFPLVDKDAVHERDLAGRAAERKHADLGPHEKRLVKSGFG